MLLVAARIGIAFYVLGGRFGRQRILVASAVSTLALTVGFYFARAAWLIWVLYILLYQGQHRHLVRRRLRLLGGELPDPGPRVPIGWLGAMFAAGLIVGSGVWTGLIAAQGAITFLIVGGGFAAIQAATVLWLPHIKPGQELEDIAT